MSRSRGLRYSRDRFRLPVFPESPAIERYEPFDGGDWLHYRADEPNKPSPFWHDARICGGAIAFFALIWLMSGGLS